MCSTPRRGPPAIGAALALVLLIGCGASVSTVYEGDVRFERCIALESRRETGDPDRRACWREWLAYHTFGQTRDRVDYARNQLGEGTEAALDASLGELAAPEPTSAFAPPPMLVNKGPQRPAEPQVPAAPLSPAPATSPPTATTTSCEADCAEAREDCRADCSSALCEKACTSKLSRCLERCTRREQ